MKGAIILACTNKVVNAINSQELDKIDSPEKVYKALYWGEYDKEIPKMLKLKIGARVMLTINNPTDGYCNGDMGNITEMNITGVRVKLDSGEIVDVPQYDFKTQIFEDGETQTIGGIKQLPLKLAWAITVHKSQGQTFDKVNFLYDKGFFDGANENRTLLYVGLSRARKIENLYLRIKGNLPRFNNEAIVDFYNGNYKTYTSRFDGMVGF
jgi:ATP-dependent exoDNAse (exonuclease V) alpha subunit